MKRGACAGLAATMVLAAGYGCCPKVPAAPPAPVPPLAVSVAAEPGPATVFLKEQSLGTTPLLTRLQSLDQVAGLTARQGGELAMEQRVQALSDREFKVLFRFGSEPSAVAKKLGLTRVLVFDFSDQVLFDFAKSELKPESLPILLRQAEVLRDFFPGVDVNVCGHTDSVGSEDANLKLSLQRAEAVASQLEKSGLPRSRMKIHGLGEGFPVATNDTDTGRALNRRTELVLPR